MTQDGLLIGVTIGCEGRVTPLALTHTPTLTRVIGQWAESAHSGSRPGPPRRAPHPNTPAHHRPGTITIVLWHLG